MTAIILSLSVMVLPASAAPDDLVSYTFTRDEMDLLLSTCLTSGISHNPGGTNSFKGTWIYEKSLSTDDSYIISYFSDNYNPHPQNSCTVVFKFTVDLQGYSLQFNVSSGFAEKPVYLRDNYTYDLPCSSLVPLVNDSILSDDKTQYSSFIIPATKTCKIEAKQAKFTSTFNELTSIDTISVSTVYPLISPWFSESRQYFNISAITYTAPKSVIDDTLGQLDEISKKIDINTDKIILNQNENTQAIIKNHNENIDKIISSLDTPSESTQNQLDVFNQQIDSADTKLDILSDGMHVNAPDLEAELDLSVIDDNLDIDVINPIFSSIFGYPWVLTMILISLSTSLLGVIIRGKRH